MKNMGILGAILIVVGVGALFFGHFSYTDTKPILKAGPLEINSQESHTVWACLWPVASHKPPGRGYTHLVRHHRIAVWQREIARLSGSRLSSPK
jgi:hypothetical protein